jgi:hypothetical protein
VDRIIEIKVNGNYLTKDNKNAGVRGEGNATKLRITFDEGWNGYAKRVTFWDALGNNPTKIILDDIDEQDVAIPGEAMTEAGMLTFVIDGFLGDKRQRSVSDRLCVKDAPLDDNAGEPAEATPPLTAQLQKEIQDNKDEISKTNNRIDDVEEDFREAVNAIETEIDENQKNTTDNFAKVNEDIEQLKSNKADLINGKVPASQLPAFVDDVIEGKLISISGVTVFSVEGIPVTPENGKIYVDTLTNKQFRWSGTQYIEISESLALGETESTAYSGANGKKNAEDIEGLKANKVDKEDGKGLSTNDFTNQEKEKLAGLKNYDDTDIKRQIKTLGYGNTLAINGVQNLNSYGTVDVYVLQKDIDFITDESGTVITGTVDGKLLDKSGYTIAVPDGITKIQGNVETFKPYIKANKIILPATCEQMENEPIEVIEQVILSEGMTSFYTIGVSMIGNLYLPKSLTRLSLEYIDGNIYGNELSTNIDCTISSGNCSLYCPKNINSIYTENIASIYVYNSHAEVHGIHDILTLYGYAGSTAEAFAKENGYTFVNVGSDYSAEFGDIESAVDHILELDNSLLGGGVL